MDDRELGAFLDSMGHHPAGIERRGDNGNFRGHCSCGYVSTRRRTFELAAEALIHHMRKTARELLSEVNGVSAVQTRLRG